MSAGMLKMRGIGSKDETANKQKEAISVELLTDRELQALIEDNIKGKVMLISSNEFKNNVRFEFWSRAGVVYRVQAQGVLDRTYEMAWRL
jgi:hypothetical protein